jgi:alcohol dehydrogenase, propanol-preferring
VFPGGGGGVGHMGVQLAKAMGMRVIAIDGGEEKKELCLKTLGADEFIDFTQAPQMVRIGGKVMCIGLRKSLP